MIIFAHLLGGSEEDQLNDDVDWEEDNQRILDHVAKE